jgi:hypothetical protein
MKGTQPCPDNRRNLSVPGLSIRFPSPSLAKNGVLGLRKLLDYFLPQEGVQKHNEIFLSQPRNKLSLKTGFSKFSLQSKRFLSQT